MKTKQNRKAIAITASILLISSALFAQPCSGKGGNGNGYGRSSNITEEERIDRMEDRVDYMAYKLQLTDEQKTKILALNKKHQEERNKERAEMQKRREEAYQRHQSEIKALLTDEQKTMYDENFGRRKGYGKGKR